MNVTKAQLRHAVKMSESEPHCWHSDDDSRVCMREDHHGGEHDYVDSARIIIKAGDGPGVPLFVTVKP